MNRVFDKNLFILEELFGKEEVSVKLDRLKYIFENTEEKWAENLKLLKNSEIRYLLICEAPPFSEIEPPKYFYNYHNKNFNKEIWKTFYPNEIFPNDKEYYFNKLVEVGFLIIDTLPYSMFFQNKRKNKNYYNLLKNSFEWFIEKLNQEELKLSKNLKIAFGFKVNAERFIEITKGNLKLKNNITLNFNKDNIAYDGSGIPHAKVLRKIFFSESEYSIYKYFNGEEENPYKLENDFELSFLNPKSLFWHYEKNHFVGERNGDNEDYKNFIENLIHNKLSEYHRSDYELWQMYFENAVK